MFPSVSSTDAGNLVSGIKKFSSSAKRNNAKSYNELDNFISRLFSGETCLDDFCYLSFDNSYDSLLRSRTPDVECSHNLRKNIRTSFRSKSCLTTTRSPVTKFNPLCDRLIDSVFRSNNAVCLRRFCPVIFARRFTHISYANENQLLRWLLERDSFAFLFFFHPQYLLKYFSALEKKTIKKPFNFCIFFLYRFFCSLW